jgi:hypothetical protein
MNTDQNVCDDQDSFNQAFHQAIKYNEKQMIKDAGPWFWVYLGLWVIFFFWAICLAMRVPPGNNRIEHLVFAMLFSPFYVIAYYISGMSNGGSIYSSPMLGRSSMRTGKGGSIYSSPMLGRSSMRTGKGGSIYSSPMLSGSSMRTGNMGSRMDAPMSFGKRSGYKFGCGCSSGKMWN